MDNLLSPEQLEEIMAIKPSITISNQVKLTANQWAILFDNYNVTISSKG